MPKTCPTCGSRWIKQGFSLTPKPTLTNSCEDCGWREVIVGEFIPAEKTNG